MFKTTIRTLINVWENDGKCYLQDYTTTLKKKYGLDPTIETIVRFNGIEYAVINLEGSTHKIVEFTKKIRGVKYYDGSSGLTYLMILGM